jgi:hypothetical protein
MIRRIPLRGFSAAAIFTFILALLATPAAQADVLSVLPASCGSEPASQPFARWGDLNNYTLVPGGNFETGGTGWQFARGAKVVSGNETYYVGSSTDSHSLALPAGSSATSPSACTSIYEPTVRLFVRNTGAASSRLTVQAIYPGLLGGLQTTTIGELSGTSSWAPTPALTLLVSNLSATVSLNTTTIAFRFAPADTVGSWSIDDVYQDPWGRS